MPLFENHMSKISASGGLRKIAARSLSVLPTAARTPAGSRAAHLTPVADPLSRRPGTWPREARDKNNFCRVVDRRVSLLYYEI